MLTFQAQPTSPSGRGETKESAPDDEALSSGRDWGASELVRVGDDPIDKQIRKYFAEHPGFQVFTNKLQPGLYTFGKPVQLKVYMKMAAGEVVVRINRAWKRLDRWLDDFRRDADTEGDAEGNRRPSVPMSSDARRQAGRSSLVPPAVLSP